MVLLCYCLLYATVALLYPHVLAVTSELHCTDFAGNEIPQGIEFMPDKAEPCNVCLCDRGYATGCRSVSCSPSCTDYKQVDGFCCKFVCNGDMDADGGGGFGRNGTANGDGSGDSTVLEGDTFANLGLRLVATTVTCFLVLALLLFMVHRIRQKRILVAMRRYEERRRQQLDDDDQNFFPPSFIGLQCPPYEDLPPPYSPPKPPPPRIEPDEDPPPYEAIEGSNSESNNNTSSQASDSVPQNTAITNNQHVTEGNSDRSVGVGLENSIENGTRDILDNCSNSNTDMGSSEVIFHRNLVRFISDFSANNRQLEKTSVSTTSNSGSNRGDVLDNKVSSPHGRHPKPREITRDEALDSNNGTEVKIPQLNTCSANTLVSIGIERNCNNDNVANSIRGNVGFTTFGHPTINGLGTSSTIGGNESIGNHPDQELEATSSLLNNHCQYSSLPTKVMPPFARIRYVDTDSNKIPNSGHKKSKSCGENSSFGTFFQSSTDKRDQEQTQNDLDTGTEKKSSRSSVNSHQYGSPGSSHPANRMCNQQYSHNRNSAHPNKLDSSTGGKGIRSPGSPSNDFYSQPSQKSESVMSDLSVLSICSETGEKRTSQSGEALQNDAVYPDVWSRQSRDHNTTHPAPSEVFLDSEYCVLGNRLNETRGLAKVNMKPSVEISSPLKRSDMNSTFPGGDSVCTVKSDNVMLEYDNEIDIGKMQKHQERYPNVVTSNKHADPKKRQIDNIRKSQNDQKFSKRFSTGSLPQQKHCRTEQFSSKSPLSHHHDHIAGQMTDNSSPKHHGRKEAGFKQPKPYKQYGFIDDPSILVDFWNRANIVTKNNNLKEKKAPKNYSHNQVELNGLRSDEENDMHKTSSAQSQWIGAAPVGDSLHSKRHNNVNNSPASLRVHRQKPTGLAVHEICENLESPAKVALRQQGPRKKGCLPKHDQHRKSFPDSQNHTSANAPSILMTQSLGERSLIVTDSMLKSSKVKRTTDDSDMQLDCSHGTSYV